MNISLYDTEIMYNARVSDSLHRVVEYAVTNRNMAVSVDDFVNMVIATRSILQTPMAEFSLRLIQSNAIRNFAPIYINAKTSGLPETLTSPSIVVDLKQAKSNSLKSIPEYKDKILLNISSCVKQDRTTGRFMIDNIQELQDKLTMCQLAASYFDMEKDWMPTLGLNFLVKSYSIILANELSRYFQCNVSETSLISCCCAVFMAQRLPSCNGFRSPYVSANNTLGASPREIEYVIESAENEFANQLVNGVMIVDHLCKLIRMVVGGRLNAINKEIFLQCCGHFGTDSITSKTALEYPPYWAYLLFKAVSNTKTAMSYQLSKQRLTKNVTTDLVNPILRHKPVYENIRG